MSGAVSADTAPSENGASEEVVGGIFAIPTEGGLGISEVRAHTQVRPYEDGVSFSFTTCFYVWGITPTERKM